MRDVRSLSSPAGIVMRPRAARQERTAAPMEHVTDSPPRNKKESAPAGRRWNNHQTTTTGGRRRSTSATGHIVAKTSKEQARLSCTVPACMFSYSPFPCIGRQQL